MDETHDEQKIIKIKEIATEIATELLKNQKIKEYPDGLESVFSKYDKIESNTISDSDKSEMMHYLDEIDNNQILNILLSAVPRCHMQLFIECISRLPNLTNYDIEKIKLCVVCSDQPEFLEILPEVGIDTSPYKYQLMLYCIDFGCTKNLEYLLQQDINIEMFMEEIFVEIYGITNPEMLIADFIDHPSISPFNSKIAEGLILNFIAIHNDDVYYRYLKFLLCKSIQNNLHILTEKFLGKLDTINESDITSIIKVSIGAGNLLLAKMLLDRFDNLIDFDGILLSLMIWIRHTYDKKLRIEMIDYLIERERQLKNARFLIF